MTLTPTATTGATTDGSRRWQALAFLALIQFILVLDVTVVNTALPSIQHDLHFSRAGLAWVLDGYTLTAGGLLLLGGRLADLLGRRRMFLIGLALFTLASAASGAAVNPGMLVASRFVQGAGEAIASPAAFGLIALLFPDGPDRAKALGIFGGVAGLGGTFGPVISGLLIEAVSWRWIFYINLPVAALSMFAVVRLVGESRADEALRRRRPDVAGAVLGTAGLSGVVFGLIEAGTHPWGSGRVLGPLLGGVALLVVFAVVERVIAAPLVPLDFFSNRVRVGTNVSTLFFAAVFFSLFFLLTLYLQESLHWSALKAGVSYLPFGVAIGAGIGVGSNLATRVGVKPLMVTGFALAVVGTFLLTRITPQGDWLTQVLPTQLINGFGSGLCFMAFGNGSVHQVSQDDASLASGVNSAVQQVGGAIGLAVLSTVSLRSTLHALRHMSPPAAVVHGYVVAFRVSAVVAAIGLVVVIAVLKQFRPGATPPAH